MTDTEKCWVLMECVDVYRDGHEHPGEQKMQISPPMTKKQALAAQVKAKVESPNTDFSIRKLCDN
jgi:hypothetical protein